MPHCNPHWVCIGWRYTPIKGRKASDFQCIKNTKCIYLSHGVLGSDELYTRPAVFVGQGTTEPCCKDWFSEYKTWPQKVLNVLVYLAIRQETIRSIVSYPFPEDSRIPKRITTLATTCTVDFGVSSDLIKFKSLKKTLFAHRVQVNWLVWYELTCPRPRWSAEYSNWVQEQNRNACLVLLSIGL